MKYFAYSSIGAFISSALLVACGGGGVDYSSGIHQVGTEVVTVYNRPTGTGDSLEALHGGLGFGLYAQNGNAVASVNAGAGKVVASVTVPSGNSFGGLLLESFSPGSTWTPSRTNPSVGTGTLVYGNFGNEKRLRIQVASTGAARVVVRLFPHGGPYDDCVPTYLLAVNARVMPRDIALDDVNWFVPSRCTALQRARTAQATVSDLHAIGVGLTEQSEPSIANGVARTFTLGEISFVH